MSKSCRASFYTFHPDACRCDLETGHAGSHEGNAEPFTSHGLTYAPRYIWNDRPQPLDWRNIYAYGTPK